MSWSSRTRRTIRIPDTSGNRIPTVPKSYVSVFPEILPARCTKLKIFFYLFQKMATYIFQLIPKIVQISDLFLIRLSPDNVLKEQFRINSDKKIRLKCLSNY